MPVMTTFHGFFQASEGPQLIGGLLARAAIRGHFIGNLLVLLKGTKAGTLDSADMHEDVLAAVFGLNEAITLGFVEPLNFSVCQNLVSLSWIELLKRSGTATSKQVFALKVNDLPFQGRGGYSRGEAVGILPHEVAWVPFEGALPVVSLSCVVFLLSDIAPGFF